ncbi:uncharacterized protein LOC116383825 isoform X2 [Anarrhichthys ocellatus]|nr:uncharacterized protein LOC116383825 isoform X2 [Anarrhichthys ocellatus]
MWKLAGADLNKPGYDGQTALRLAHAIGKKEVVAFLVQLMGKKSKPVFGEFNEYDEDEDDDDEVPVTQINCQLRPCFREATVIVESSAKRASDLFVFHQNYTNT